MYDHPSQSRRRPATEPVHRRRIGRYQLCLELASGGMATVYLARALEGPSSSPPLALKVIHPHLTSDRDFVEMFADEADLASRIRHPNVCGVLDYDVANGEHYIALEYLVGESLGAVQRKLRQAGAVDIVRTARCVAAVLSEACQGLHAAHELTDEDGEPLRVVHRDVSPENVFLTYDGVAKIVDFGVASAARKRHRTQTGMLKGKFGYVAPELIRGASVDRRVDVWGIGVLGWELLTGKRLFRTDNELDTLRAVIEAPIPPPSHEREGLPEGIDEVIGRALARDPDERYATARELGRELAKIATAGGEVTTAGDLAEWMRELFPGGKEQRLQLIRFGEQMALEDADRESERASEPPRSSSPPPRTPSVPPPPRVASASEPPDPLDEPTRLAGSTAPSARTTAWQQTGTQTGPGMRQGPWAQAPWIFGALAFGAFGGVLVAQLFGLSAQPSGADAQVPHVQSAPQTPPAVARRDGTPAEPTRSLPAQLRLPLGEDATALRGRYVLEVGGTDDELHLRLRPMEPPEPAARAEAGADPRQGDGGGSGQGTGERADGADELAPWATRASLARPGGVD